MALGRRGNEQQPSFWIAVDELPQAGSWRLPQGSCEPKPLQTLQDKS